MDVLSLLASLCFGLVLVDEVEAKGSPRAIRLVGPTAYIGQVQIFHDSQWISVCQDYWNLKNGRVVCRQLGYTRADSVSVRALGYARLDGDQGYSMQGFKCRGNEARLDLCPLLAGNWTTQECSRGTAGVICRTPTDTTYPVRLMDGQSDNEGRVEIKHGGEWTTVCDRGWDKTDADIVCHQLGYGKAVRATTGASYGPGKGTILLSNVKCKEDDLRFRLDVRYCNVTDWYPSEDECTHADDAGVECETRDPSLEIRLTGPDRDTVQIKYNEDWMSICDENWNMNDANVACRQLGYESAEAAPSTGYHGWQGYYLRNFLCTGNESRLDMCKKRGSWMLQRCANDRFAGVRCRSNHQTIHVHNPGSGGGRHHVKHHRASAVESVIVVAIVCGILLFVFSGYFVGHKARQRRKRKERSLQLDETETGTISLEENEMEEIMDPAVVVDDTHYASDKDDIPLVKEDENE